MGMTEALPMTAGLEFEAHTHTYRLDGIALPSVTQVMQPLSQAHYGGIPGSALDAAAERGTSVHGSIEDYLKRGVDEAVPEYGGYYDAFKKWMADAGPQVLGSECRVFHRSLRYAGTADMACGIGGEAVLIDIKTSSKIVEMLARVQLEAYKRAFESQGYRFARKAVLHLRNDGTYRYEDSYEPVDSEAWEAFAGLLVLRNYIEKYRR